MKKLIVLLALPFLPLSVEAGSRSYQPGYSQEQTCYEYVYREEYIPGTYNNPGKVVSSREKVEKPCSNSTPTHYHEQPNQDVDDNSCIEGSILGGILGGGAAAAASRGDGRWWAIPLGVVGGSMVGCQIDGG